MALHRIIFFYYLWIAMDSGFLKDFEFVLVHLLHWLQPKAKEIKSLRFYLTH